MTDTPTSNHNQPDDLEALINGPTTDLEEQKLFKKWLAEVKQEMEERQGIADS
jgi:hypothetical protein